MLGVASITKENSDSDLTKKMVSVFKVHVLQGRACILSEKGFHSCTGEERFVSSPSCAAPRIGRHSVTLRASWSCSHGFLVQASQKGSESGTHVLWCQVTPSSFDPGPEKPSDVDKNLGQKPRQKPQASVFFLCSPPRPSPPPRTDWRLTLPTFHTNSCRCK